MTSLQTPQRAPVAAAMRASSGVAKRKRRTGTQLASLTSGGDDVCRCGRDAPSREEERERMTMQGPGTCMPTGPEG